MAYGLRSNLCKHNLHFLGPYKRSASRIRSEKKTANSAVWDNCCKLKGSHCFCSTSSIMLIWCEIISRFSYLSQLCELHCISFWTVNLSFSIFAVSTIVSRNFSKEYRQLDIRVTRILYIVKFNNILSLVLFFLSYDHRHDSALLYKIWPELDSVHRLWLLNITYKPMASVRYPEFLKWFS